MTEYIRIGLQAILQDTNVEDLSATVKRTVLPMLTSKVKSSIYNEKFRKNDAAMGQQCYQEFVEFFQLGKSYFPRADEILKYIVVTNYNLWNDEERVKVEAEQCKVEEANINSKIENYLQLTTIDTPELHQMKQLHALDEALEATESHYQIYIEEALQRKGGGRKNSRRGRKPHHRM
jgi:hypothetical protein